MPSSAAMIFGGASQVGCAAVAELLAILKCREVVMIAREWVAAQSCVRNVVLDAGAAEFVARNVAIAREVMN